jgi:hypothetical protein
MEARIYTASVGFRAPRCSGSSQNIVAALLGIIAKNVLFPEMKKRIGKRKSRWRHDF